MAKKKKPTKHTPSKAMPKTKPVPTAERKRRKTLLPRVTAAVSISEPLYLESLNQASRKHGNNWSGYVRSLIEADLQSA